jgi:mannose-1-phosphate guanylyltransferase
MAGNKHYAVIMAGGIGSRFWPESTPENPKQFLDLTGSGKSLLRETFERINRLVPAGQILVVSNKRYRDIIAGQLPEIHESQILQEPVMRNTAPAILYAVNRIHAFDPQASTVVLPSDHFIADEEQFTKDLQAAFAYADRHDELLTLGIRPSSPHTGYGYIEMGQPIGHFHGLEARRVLRFREKPDRATAEAFLQAGRFVWNSGMFLWRADVIMAQFRRFMPELHAALRGLQPALGTPDEAAAFERHWMPLQGNVTIDYGVMEKADRVAVFPVDLGWHDIGSWTALLDVLPRDEAGNVAQARHLGIDTRNVLVFSEERLIATVGLEDMIIVDAGDALLIMPADRAQDVKKIIQALEDQGLDGYLT